MEKKKIEIIPAVMPDHFDDLREKLSRVSRTNINFVQIDIMDGKFVHSKSWPYVGDRGHHFVKIIDQNEGIPFWEDIDFSVDMMVENPMEEYAKWISVGASMLIFHFDTLRKKDFEEIENIKSEGLIETCLALPYNFDAGRLDQYIEAFSSVQVMGIENIGYQGENFQEESLNTIKQIREKYPEIDIYVDGGVNYETVNDIAEAGANKLISGSAIFNSLDIDTAVEEFYKVLGV